MPQSQSHLIAALAALTITACVPTPAAASGTFSPAAASALAGASMSLTPALAGATAGAAAAAPTRSTHCGSTAAWRLIGSEETSTVRVKAWRVTSKAKPGTIAVCARAWSLAGDQWVAIRVSTDYLQRGWMVKGSGSKLTRIPDTATFITVEASNDEWATSARTEWER